MQCLAISRCSIMSDRLSSLSETEASFLQLWCKQSSLTDSRYVGLACVDRLEGVAEP